MAIALVAKRDRLGRHEFKRREQLAGRAPDEHEQVGERSAFRQLQLFGRTSRRQGSKTQHGDTNGAERSFASSAETEWQQQTGTGSGVLCKSDRRCGLGDRNTATLLFTPLKLTQ